MPKNSGQNYINHIALVLDSSTSMGHHADQLVKVADDQIAYLARKSKEMDQETRVTIYSFDNVVECLTYDKDVMRLPSIKERYIVGGQTALIEATLKSLDDLAHTWEGYGDHSFLVFVLTDGEENASGGRWHNSPAERRVWSDRLSARLASLPDHWTVAVLVPNQLAKREAVGDGFPKDNIAIWDTTSQQGVEEAVSVIRKATDDFMTGRTKGVRGTRTVFTTGGSIDAASIKAANLTPLKPSQYVLIPVVPDEEAYKERVAKGLKTADARPEIQPFVQSVNQQYRVGKAYYQLSKREKIQGNKAVAVVEKKTAKVYVGDAARQLAGLPDYELSVKPEDNAEFQLYIQSSSTNRKLEIGTKLLLLTS